MYCEEQLELKKRMKRAGITIKDVSKKLKKPYSTIGGQLGGFTPLTQEVLKAIEQLISKSEGGQND